MKRHRLWTTLPLLYAVAACYSPNVDVGRTGGGGEASTTSGAPDPSAGSPTSAADDSPADTGGGTSGSSGERGQETTVGESSESSGSEEGGSSSSGEVPAFCGDGNVDAGEECDLGADNALSAGCRPDCTLAECGDGDVWVGVEACDDGEEDNILEIGACAPDCSRVIVEKIVTLGDTLTTGNLGANPVAEADSVCPVGYKALFAYAGVREAALEAYDGSGSVDWVLQPYTAYVRDDAELVWITDHNPLLGVRDLGPVPLENSISPPCPDGFGCVLGRVVTGIESSWLTAVDNNCDDWTDGTESGTTRRGFAESTTTFLYDATYTTDCEFNILTGGGVTGVYCVEQ